jgi:hypothetical protein
VINIETFIIGDVVTCKGYNWIVTSYDAEYNTCDLINGYKEEKWNVDAKSIKLIVKSP